MVEKYEEASKDNPPFESVLKSPIYFFGLDEGWKHYYLGFSYKVLRRPEKAKEHLRTVIEKYDEPLDWAQERKKRCLEALASLESESQQVRPSPESSME